MQLNKLIITSKTGHFGKILGYDDRYTYKVPTPSTIIGILKTIYNDNIDNFKFGYLFKSDLIFKDDITIHKRNKSGSRVMKKKHPVTDARFIEMHYNCKLTIYTDIKDDVSLNYILCMGRAGNIARLHLPIRKVNLEDKEGKGYNQYTNINVGAGKIETYNMKSEYKSEFQSYDHQVQKLRLNNVFDYNKNYDEEEEQCVFMWEMNNGDVISCHD